MAFHPVRFPLDISLGARGGPQRYTDIVTLASGAEERNARWATSRRRFNAGYGVKSLSDMQAVLDFFEERRGRFHSFLWRDGFDYSSALAGAPLGSGDQVLGTGDAVKTQFQLIKKYGANFDPYDRAITKPVSSTVRAAMDGVEVLITDFTVDNQTGLLTFNTAPGAGVVVTAGFEFDVPVRFENDQMNIEHTSFDAANIADIPVIEVRE